jgi:hypothetical protein
MVLSFSFDRSVHYGQRKKDNTMVKRKRQHYGQKKKTTMWSKEKDNTMVKRKRQHYGQKKNTTLRSKEKDVLSFSFDRSVVFSF